MEVSSRRLAIVQHRHPPARGLLSLISLLSAFLLTGIKRNQAPPRRWPRPASPAGDVDAHDGATASAVATDVTVDGSAVTVGDAALAPTGGVTMKQRAEHSHTGQNARTCLRALSTFLPGEMGPRGLPPLAVLTGPISYEHATPYGRRGWASFPGTGGARGVVVACEGCPL